MWVDNEWLANAAAVRLEKCPSLEPLCCYKLLDTCYKSNGPFTIWIGHTFLSDSLCHSNYLCGYVKKPNGRKFMKHTVAKDTVLCEEMRFLLQEINL